MANCHAYRRPGFLSQPPQKSKVSGGDMRLVFVETVQRDAECVNENATGGSVAKNFFHLADVGAYRLVVTGDQPFADIEVLNPVRFKAAGNLPGGHSTLFQVGLAFARSIENHSMTRHGKRS